MVTKRDYKQELKEIWERSGEWENENLRAELERMSDAEAQQLFEFRYVV